MDFAQQGLKSVDWYLRLSIYLMNFLHCNDGSFEKFLVSFRGIESSEPKQAWKTGKLTPSKREKLEIFWQEESLVDTPLTVRRGKRCSNILLFSMSGLLAAIVDNSYSMQW